jgi:hypothetical protein
LYNTQFDAKAEECSGAIAANHGVIASHRFAAASYNRNKKAGKGAGKIKKPEILYGQIT